MKTIDNQKDATSVRRQEIVVLKVQGEDVRQNGAVARYNPDDLDEFVRQGRLVPSARVVLED